MAITLSIIVPVYNEERTIEMVIERIRAVELGDISKEILIVDDGSSDGTRRAIERAAWRGDPRIRVHANPINLGKGAAVRVGFHHATGELLLIQDADLELDPGQYGIVLAPLLEGRASVVYGSRFLAPSAPVPFTTRFGNWLVTMLTNVLFGVRLTDMETGSKAFRREALNGLRLRAVGFDIEPELTGKLLRSGRQIVEVPIRYAPRGAADGKKIRWLDAFDAIYALLKARFGQSGRPQQRYTTADDGGHPAESRASYR